MIAAPAQRKLLHLATAAIPVAWAYSLVGADAVRSALTLAAVVASAIEFFRRRDAQSRARFDAIFGRWLKPQERDGFTGATWLALAMLGAVLLFPAPAARAALWAGAAGDAAASLVGTALRRRGGAPGKTIVGAAACAVITALGVWWLAPSAWWLAAILGVVAAAAEWPARWGDDNARVTLATGLAARLLGVG